MNNKESFLWWSEATKARNFLIPKYATKVEIKKDDKGYWLNVWWKCGIVAPLTIQEHIQSQGNPKC